MIKLIIADDEELIRKRLTKCIPWNKMGYEIAAEASDGEELWDKIAEYKPDAVLTDVRMPGIDGLEVLDMARKFGLDTQFVIISGYKDFEYVQKGVDAGIFAYVLKPIDKAKIIERFEKLATVINESKKKHREKKEMLLRLIKDMNDAEFEADEDFFKEGGAIIRIYGDEVNNDVTGLIKMCLDEILVNYYIIDDREKYITVFYDGSAESVLEQQALDLFYCINDNISDIDKNGAVSVYYTNTFFSKTDFIEAFGIIKNTELQRIYIGKKVLRQIHEKYDEPIKQDSFIMSDDTEEKLIKYIRNFDFEQVKTEFKKLPLHGLTYNNAKTTCFLFINSVYRILSGMQQSPTIKIIFKDFLEMFDECEFIDTMQQCVINCIDRLGDGLSDNGRREDGYIINKALKYINENLHRDISLNDVAEVLEVSYGYMSRLLNNGKYGGFVVYLREKRIQKAKELLKNTNKKIYEIAADTGFKSTRYFSETFKKQVGMTPLDYRNGR